MPVDETPEAQPGDVAFILSWLAEGREGSRSQSEDRPG